MSKPDFTAAQIASVLTQWGVTDAVVTAGPSGADPDATAYRVQTGTGDYFLKAKRGSFDPVSGLPRQLFDCGFIPVVAPLPTHTGTLWASANDCFLMLFPFVEGKNGFQAALSSNLWRHFGGMVRDLQRIPPEQFAHLLPQEDYAPRWRDKVRYWHGVSASPRSDSASVALYGLWRVHAAEIQILLERAEQLAAVLQTANLPCVVCHADMHAGNVLLTGPDTLLLIDWNTARLAPKERDLLFIGNGIGGVWNNPREAEWFYEGYGEAVVSQTALAYFRYERILEDIAVVARDVWESGAGTQTERAEAVDLFADQFTPKNVLDIAQETYQRCRIDLIR